jgi:hypothetical protein
VNIPRESMYNLDNKAKMNIFVGYKYGIKDYIIWNPVTRNIVYSQDVVLREELMWGKFLSTNRGTP